MGTKVESGVLVFGHCGSSENFQATWGGHEVCASIREGAVQKRIEVCSGGGFRARSTSKRLEIVDALAQNGVTQVSQRKFGPEVEIGGLRTGRMAEFVGGQW